ncbi:MAG: N-acetylmuramoyl-L-alanine amidase family protein [Bacillota bacterium]
MKPRVLNAWPAKRRETDGNEVSVISLESTCPPGSIDVEGIFPAPGGEHLVHVVLRGLGLTMAEDEILVADGLIRHFRVRRGQGEEPVSVEIRTEFPVKPDFSVTPGMPSRTDITFPREPLAALMSGRQIIVDPGHGGRDAGVRGPVNLLEKDCALEVAKELESLLRNAGAVPLLTRDSDLYLAPGSRLAGILSGVRTSPDRRPTPLHPELAVEIHMSGEKDPLARSYHCYFAEGCARAPVLAESIAAALNERMGTAFPGLEKMESEGHGFPVVRIEPVCLTHFADEANFRAPLYRKRIAQGIFNGIARYLRKGGQ